MCSRKWRFFVLQVQTRKNISQIYIYQRFMWNVCVLIDPFTSKLTWVRLSRNVTPKGHVAMFFATNLLQAPPRTHVTFLYIVCYLMNFFVKELRKTRP
jgi:hypothetical protein